MGLSRLDVTRYCELVKEGKLRTEAAEELQIPYREIARRRRTDKAFALEEQTAVEISEELQLGVVRREIRERMLDRGDKESARLLVKEAMRLDPLYNERRPVDKGEHAGVQIIIAGMLEPRVQVREVGGGEAETVEVLPAAPPAKPLPR